MIPNLINRARILTLLGSFRVLRFYLPHLLALGAAVFLGVAMGFVTILGKPPAVDTTDRWSLPRWAPYVAGPKREALARDRIWFEEPGKRREETVVSAVPPWRFIGTVKDGDKLLAVIELDKGKRVQRLTQGDPLPNGAPITRIGTGEISYAQDNAETTLKLFGVTKDQNFPAGKKN